MMRGDVGQVQHQWGFAGVVWGGVRGKRIGVLDQIALRVERGGFGASECGRVAPRLLGCGG